MFTKQEKLLFKSQSSDHLRVKNKKEKVENGLDQSNSSLEFLPIAQLKKDEIPSQFKNQTQMKMNEEVTLLLYMDLKTSI